MLQAVPVNVGNPIERSKLPYQFSRSATSGLNKGYIGAWRVIEDASKFESKEGAVVAADMHSLRRILDARNGAPEGTSLTDGVYGNGFIGLREIPKIRVKMFGATTTHPTAQEVMSAAQKSPNGVFVHMDILRSEYDRYGIVWSDFRKCKILPLRGEYLIRKSGEGAIVTYDPSRVANLVKLRAKPAVGTVKVKNKVKMRSGLLPLKRCLVAELLRTFIRVCWAEEFEFVVRKPGGYNYSAWWYDIDAMMDTCMHWHKLAKHQGLIGECRKAMRPVTLDLGDLFKARLRTDYHARQPEFIKWFEDEYKRAGGKGKPKFIKDKEKKRGNEEAQVQDNAAEAQDAGIQTPAATR